MAATGIKYFTDFAATDFSFVKIIGTASILTFLTVLAVFFKYAIKRRSYNQILPGRKIPFASVLGNVADFPSKKNRLKLPLHVYFLQVLGGVSRLFKNEKLFCFWISFEPFVILVKAEAVEDLICGTKIMKKGWIYNWLHPWLGTGLLTSHGTKWKSRRKLLTPSFHFEILKDFLPIFNEQSQILVEMLEKETKKPWVDIILPATLCTLDIICETTLGTTVGAQRNANSEYVKAVLRASEIIMERMLAPELWPEFYFGITKKGREFKHCLKLLHDFTRSVIQDKKRRLVSGDPDAGKRKRKALMDCLLDHHIQNQDFSEEDIREEVDTFAFEGHDTTSMGVSWSLYLIGLHKDVQENIHEELDRIFGEDLERPATTDDIKDMEYLDRVLKESQRLYPSVPIFGRHIEKDTIIAGYKVPKGTMCNVLTYLLHRDENVFPNPEKFDPDRFLPENSLNRHPYAYVPFSAGPRNCIGQRFAVMEEKVIVSTVLRNFTLESLDPRDKILPAAELILRSAQPLRIKVTRRHPKAT